MGIYRVFTPNVLLKILLQHLTVLGLRLLILEQVYTQLSFQYLSSVIIVYHELVSNVAIDNRQLYEN